MYRVFTNQASNADSSTFTPKREIPADGITVEIHVWGTFGGGNVTLQQSPDGGTTWHNVSSAISTAGRSTHVICSGAPLRVSIAGAAGPSLNVTISNLGIV